MKAEGGCARDRSFAEEEGRLKNNGPLNAPQEYPDFFWVEVARGHFHQIPPRMIPLRDLTQWIEESGDEELYSSLYRYSIDDPNIGAILGGFAIDLDCEKDPERARKEAIALVSYLKAALEIPEENIAILFTGRKGFRIIVNRRSFDFHPLPFLSLIHKEMASDIAKALNLKTVDLKIYHRRSLIRLENTKHGRSGLYQIRLTFDELKRLKIEDIKELATKPRYLKMSVKNVISKKAHEFYLKHKEAVEKRLEGKKESFSSVDVAALSSDVPCVKARFEKGAEEGERNNSVFQLSIYWTKRGLPLDEVKALAMQFNERCKPPLDEREVLRTVESAFKGASEGRYGVGCSSEAFFDLCVGRDSCPLFKGEPLEVFDESVKKEALKLLESEDLEQRIVETLDLDVVGEEKNKTLGFYGLCSGKKSDPTKKLILVLLSEAGAGKTTLANALCQYFKTKKRARFSPHALDYSDLAAHEVLYLQEIVLGQTEDKGTSIATIRFLSADDKGYEVEVVVPNEKSAGFKTETYKIPPITVISTTTDLSLDPQFERRALFLSLDESPEQTARVLKFKDEREDAKFEEALGLREKERRREVLKCALCLLEDGDVVIPFKNALRGLMDIRVLRVRGDYDKIKNLIKLRAWVHQRQRPYFESKDGKKIWIALPEDGIRILELAEGMLRRWRTNLDERVAKVIPRLIEIQGDDGELTSAAIAKKLNVAQVTARKWLKHLTERGAVVVVGEARNRRSYAFIAPKDEIEKKLIESIFLTEIDQISPVFEKETEEWLNKYAKNLTLKNAERALKKHLPPLLKIEISAPQSEPFPASFYENKPSESISAPKIDSTGLFLKEEKIKEEGLAFFEVNDEPPVGYCAACRRLNVLREGPDKRLYCEGCYSQIFKGETDE